MGVEPDASHLLDEHPRLLDHRDFPDLSLITHPSDLSLGHCCGFHIIYISYNLSLIDFKFWLFVGLLLLVLVVKCLLGFLIWVFLVHWNTFPLKWFKNLLTWVLALLLLKLLFNEVSLMLVSLPICSICFGNPNKFKSLSLLLNLTCINLFLRSTYQIKSCIHKSWWR